MSAFAVHQAKKYGNKKQRCHSRTRQPPDHRASKWSILLAAFPQAKSHRHHSNDHGERSHQHWPESSKARFDRRIYRRLTVCNCSVAKLTTRMLLAVATPMHMMDPVKRRYAQCPCCVSSKNQTMPVKRSPEALQ